MHVFIHTFDPSLKGYNFNEMVLAIKTSVPLEEGWQLLHHRSILKKDF